LTIVFKCVYTVDMETTTWTKTGEWSQYRATLADGTTITVSKYFPGENWWVGQNFYWAWQIDRPDGNQFTPNGEYERTLKECKEVALRYERNN
jgi:hypothetical protein